MATINCYDEQNHTIVIDKKYPEKSYYYKRDKFKLRDGTSIDVLSGTITLIKDGCPF